MKIKDSQKLARKQIAIVGMASKKELNALRTRRKSRILELEKLGLKVRNKGQSIYWKRISPGCIDCSRGTGLTVSFSEECNRNCFFCFYPGPQQIKSSRKNFPGIQRQFSEAIKKLKVSSDWILSFAVTGGEPLLELDTTLAIFDIAKNLSKGTYQTRLYTNGDLLNDKILEQFKNVQLDEIRIGFKPGQRNTKKIELAKKFIPRVMIEMPVFPDKEKWMKSFLIKLDDIGIFGINLMEMVFSCRKASVYKKKGYKLITNKINPFPSPHAWDYEVYGSEEVCFNLLEFAAKEKLSIGVHYCSLQNRKFGNRADRRKRKNMGKTLKKSKNFKKIYTE